MLKRVFLMAGIMLSAGGCENYSVGEFAYGVLRSEDNRRCREQAITADQHFACLNRSTHSAGERKNSEPGTTNPK